MYAQTTKDRISVRARFLPSSESDVDIERANLTPCLDYAGGLFIGNWMANLGRMLLQKHFFQGAS